MTVTALFFMWDFISCMNDLLIPKFKADFHLNQFQANLVQFAFFGAYFLVSLAYFLISAAKGDPINKIGYKNGLVLGRSNPGKMVGLFALVAMALTALSMNTKGEFALWSIIGIGLFNSIMWSNIFSLSIRGLGKDTSQGSSLLVMMIVGGAIMPLIQGALMDSFGVRTSLGIVFFGYAYLVYFGFFGARADEIAGASAARVSGGH